MFSREVKAWLGFSQVSVAGLQGSPLSMVQQPHRAMLGGEHRAQRRLCTLVDSVNQIWVGTYRVPVSHLMAVSAAGMGSHLTMGLYPLLLDFKTVLKSYDCAGNDYKDSKLRWPLWHRWRMLWMFKHIKDRQSARWLCDLVMIGTPTDLLLLNPISVGGSWMVKISSLPIIMWI